MIPTPTTRTYRHKPTGQIHLLIEIYQEAGEQWAVTVERNYLLTNCNTHSYLGQMRKFKQEFELVKE